MQIADWQRNRNVHTFSHHVPPPMLCPQCVYCQMPFTSVQARNGHIGRCKANPKNKLRRTTCKKICASDSCNHQGIQDIAEEQTDERGDEEMYDAVDEPEQDGADEQEEEGSNVVQCSADQQNGGAVKRYLTSQTKRKLERRISILALEEIEFSPQDRDEIRLLDIALKYNLPEEAFDDIAKWSDERASSNTKLKTYRALKPTITEGVVDISFMREIEVPNTRNDIEDSEEEDETQEGPTIKRDIVCNDIISVSLELFDKMKPKLVHFDESETLQYLNQGEWWRNAEEKYCYQDGTLVPDTYLFPIITFVDGVLAANGGKLSIEPVLVTLGLFDTTELSKEGYREYVASLEKTVASKAEKTNVSDVELDVFHRSLDIIFSPIRECAQAGGFKYEVDGAEVTLVPLIPFLVQDTDEGNKLCAVFNNWHVQKPCRICEVSFENCDKPNCNAPLRKQSEQRELVESCSTILQEKAYGTVTAARDKLKQESLKPIRNAFWDLPCGGTEENGIYLACFPEKLHHFEGGLMKIYPTAFKEFYRSQFQDGGVTAALQKLDRKARKLSRILSRQSDRTLPSKYFPKGLTDVTGLTSQEFPPLVLLLVCTIGNDDTVIHNRNDRKKWTTAGWQLLIVWSWLKQDKYDKRELPHLQAAIVNMLRSFKLSAESWIPSGCKFPKFHLSLHYVQFIKLFGPPLLSYGGYWERSLKHHVKKQFQRTSKKNATAPEELRERHRFLSAFFVKHKQMIEYEAKFCGVAPERIAHRRGSQVILSGAKITNLSHIPEVSEHVMTSFEDIYRYTGPLVFRTELHLCLNGDTPTLFRADPAFKTKPWFDFAIIEQSQSAIPELAQIFGFVSAPNDKDDILMVCTILAPTGMVDFVQLKQYKKIYRESSGVDVGTQLLKYRILPVSYIKKPAFVFPNSDSTEFTLIPPRHSWVEKITPSSPSSASVPLHQPSFEPEFTVRSILRKKHTYKRGRSEGRITGTMYLVEWDGYHRCQSSWVKKANVSSDLVAEYEANNQR